MMSNPLAGNLDRTVRRLVSLFVVLGLAVAGAVAFTPSPAQAQQIIVASNGFEPSEVSSWSIRTEGGSGNSAGFERNSPHARTGTGNGYLNARNGSSALLLPFRAREGVATRCSAWINVQTSTGGWVTVSVEDRATGGLISVNSVYVGDTGTSYTLVSVPSWHQGSQPSTSLRFAVGLVDVSNRQTWVRLDDMGAQCWN